MEARLDWHMAGITELHRGFEKLRQDIRLLTTYMGVEFKDMNERIIVTKKAK